MDQRAETQNPELGELPEWNLDDLYPGMDSREYNRDMERLAQETVAFEEKYKGRLADILDSDPAELGGIIAQYEAIEELMFTFEDLRHLPGRPMQKLLGQVPRSTLLLALKISSEELKQNIFSNLSQRARDQIEGELSELPPTKRSEVEIAQREIIDTVKRLEATGEIQLNIEGEEYV